MNSRTLRRALFAIYLPLAAGLLAATVQADEGRFTVEQVVQRTVDSYPSLKVAEMQVDRASLDRPQVESLLGWQVGGQAGISHDVSFIGTPSDQLNANVNLQRQLESGHGVGMSAGYTYEDSSLSFSPLLPNPSHAATLDLNYRVPWAQGKGNPTYAQGLARAAAGVAVAQAQRQAAQDQLARQAMDLYYAIALTRVRILNAKKGIERAERLKRVIQENQELGLSEEKDLLQVEAQLRAQVAEHRNLEVAWEQQRASLNRLMGRPPNAPFLPQVSERVPTVVAAGTGLIDEAIGHSPELAQLEAQVALAEAAMAEARNAKEDKLDAVLSVGARSRAGDTQTGSVAEQDWAGGITVEYQHSVDRQGLEAALAQAQLDRSIALQQMERVKRDLRYEVESLASQIEATRRALESYRQRLEAEQQKLAEAEDRYRSGRADTQQLIQFETELYLTELAVEQQRIELARRYAQLDLLRGALWQRVVPLTSHEKGMP